MPRPRFAPGRWRAAGRHAGALALLLPLTLLASCLEAPTPVEYVWQVIEEVEFHPSLGIDLPAMTRLESGVYIQDLEPGDPTRLRITATSFVDIEYFGWISNGNRFDSGTIPGIRLGQNGLIRGMEQGLVGLREGGTRLILIPTELAYGAEIRPGIPPGSILIFEVLAVAVQD